MIEWVDTAREVSLCLPNPQPSTLNPQPSTLNPQPQNLKTSKLQNLKTSKPQNLKTSTLNLNLKPSTLNSAPYTIHPKILNPARQGNQGYRGTIHSKTTPLLKVYRFGTQLKDKIHVR